MSPYRSYFEPPPARQTRSKKEKARRERKTPTRPFRPLLHIAVAACALFLAALSGAVAHASVGPPDPVLLGPAAIARLKTAVDVKLGAPSLARISRGDLRGMEMVSRGGRVIAVRVTDASAPLARTLGLLRGDEIVSVNDLPVDAGLSYTWGDGFAVLEVRKGDHTAIYFVDWRETR